MNERFGPKGRGRRRATRFDWMSTRPTVITIKNIEVMAVHGVLPKEQTEAQPFSIDLKIFVSRTSYSDELDSTVDYAQIIDAAVQVMSGAPCQLLETLAANIASSGLECDERIQRIWCTVRKTKPPVPHSVGSVGATVMRHRNSSHDGPSMQNPASIE